MNFSAIPTSKRILVDDADARLVYQGPWEVVQGEQHEGSGSYGPPLQNTLHGIRPDASGSFIFEYEGSTAEVWGSIPDENFDADWECLVDGRPAERIDVSSIRRGRHRQKLCEWRGNEFGKHLLYVNATSRANGQFLLDYISYLPSPSDGPLNGTILIPHDDPDFSFLGSEWRIQEGSGRRTRLPTNSAQIDFFGASLEWYGFETSLFPSNPSKGSYSIDGVLPTEFVYSGLKEEGAEPNYNHLLFKTPKLTPGPHKLIVTHQGPDAPLTLSYVIVENHPNVQVPLSTKAITPAPSGPQAADASQQTESHSPSTGTIVGGVIGGLCGVALIGLLIFFFIRWRRKTHLPMIQPLPGFVKPEAAAPLDIDLVNTRRSDELYPPPSRPGSYGLQHTRRRSNARRFNPEVRSTISSVHLNPPPVQHAPPSTTNTGFDNDSIAEVSQPSSSAGTRQSELNPYAAGYPYAAMPLSDYQKLVEATKQQEAKAKASKPRDSYM